MAKVSVTITIDYETKDNVQQISELPNEGRSFSNMADVLLKKGVQAYIKENKIKLKK